MNEISAATGKLLAMSFLSGVGPATLRTASQVFGFEDKSVEQLAVDIPKLKSALSGGGWSDALIKAEEQLDLAERSGCSILSPLDPDYPKLLAATKDDPFLLWIRGTLAPSPEKSVAIIGTREPTEHGKLIAQRMTRYFVDQGWSVVSGLALGCDGIAHQEAVNTGGHTVAVLAHGLQTIAPSKHRKLAEDILNAGGALVSQYPIGREAIPQQFVQRDKTQAGMAQGVVMIQSDLQGGSLHASRASIEYGRWLAVPYPTEQDRGRNEPKIQANLRLADGSESERMELLRLKESGGLSRILVLRSKDDYARCLESTSAPAIEKPASQGSMF